MVQGWFFCAISIGVEASALGFAGVQHAASRSGDAVALHVLQPHEVSGAASPSPSNSTARSVLPSNENNGTASGKSSVRTLLDDSIVTTKIMAAMLADPGVKVTEVGVETNSGEGTLSGSVSDQTTMEQAQKITKGVSGVKPLVNNSTIKK